MNEKERLAELYSYQMLDTLADRELDELSEIAAAICDVPIALVSLLDETRQWFKSKIGLETCETSIGSSFCNHAKNTPQELFLIEDALEDERFVNNPLVTGDPFIRFYAGIPLISPKGFVLGTLCVIDTKPRTLNECQIKSLRLLAIKTMSHLNAHKASLEENNRLRQHISKLKQLTDHAPGVVFQFEVSPEGKMRFPFISEGFSKLHPQFEPEVFKNEPEQAFLLMHPEDVERLQQAIETSRVQLTELNCEYRIVLQGGGCEWHLMRGLPEKRQDGTVVWFGTFQNVTSRIAYEETMGQISFDISHVLRKPVANLLGLAAMMESEEKLDETMIREYGQHIKAVSQELEIFTKTLNETYTEKHRVISQNQMF